MKIFVTRVIAEQGIALLTEAFGKESVVVSPHNKPLPRAELLESVEGCAAILPVVNDVIDADVMDAAGPNLNIIANFGVGYNNIDVSAATERGIVVTNTPGVLTETTADLAWALIMATARRINESERYLRAGKWEAWGPQLFLGVDVHGKTLGIFGMGRIGQAVARRARGFNMRVLYTNRNRLAAEIEQELNATYVDKPTLIAESDFVSIHCPLMPETIHAFGEAEFKAMKNTACLINTSRGPVVDEAALVVALKNDEIYAAGLDVFEHEPTVHPELMDLENAVLLPHIGSASRETRTKMAEMAAQNIVACLTGKAPLNPVNSIAFTE